MRRRRRRPIDGERYRRVSMAVGQAEAAGRAAQKELAHSVGAAAKLSVVRQAYRRVGEVAQEPLPAEPALDRDRPSALSRQLSTLRTRRQWYLMDAPAGVLVPATVVPTSRAALGPRVHGLDFDLADEPWGVDLARVLDEGPAARSFASVRPS